MAWKPDYVDLAELREYATRSGETIDDAFISIAATSASRAVDGHTGRQFGKVDAAQTRRYDVWWDRREGRYVAHIDDLYSAAGLTVAVEGGPVTAFELEPVNALLEGKVYERLVIKPESANTPAAWRVRNGLSLTSDKFGWPAFPTPVKQASLLQGARLLWRRQAPHGVAGSPESGSEVRLLSKLDPDVAVALGTDLIRWWAAA